jgi:hypothetical protein
MRVIPTHLVTETLLASKQPGADGRDPDQAPVVRPERFDDATEIVRVLRAKRSVVLELDGLDDVQRRRTLDFVAGVSCGLEVNVSSVAKTEHAFLLEPNHSRRSPQRRSTRTGETAIASVAGHDVRAHHDVNATLCVLCDLRTADAAVQPPLDMVIRRDGSRVWSPPAWVCAHCRATIRYWRFALAWCAECERWGRRSVVSPCGRRYGF